MLIPFTVAAISPRTRPVNRFSSRWPVPTTSYCRPHSRARHPVAAPPRTVYTVSNLTQSALGLGQDCQCPDHRLLLIAAVTLLVSGIGIMNIMLATVSSRIREIGIRKATAQPIARSASSSSPKPCRFHWWAASSESSSAGRFLSRSGSCGLPNPISGLSAIIAIVVSVSGGSDLRDPAATRAAQLDPVRVCGTSEKQLCALASNLQAAASEPPTNSRAWSEWLSLAAKSGPQNSHRVAALRKLLLVHRKHRPRAHHENRPEIRIQLPGLVFAVVSRPSSPIRAGSASSAALPSTITAWFASSLQTTQVRIRRQVLRLAGLAAGA